MTSKIDRLLELWGLEDMVRAVNEEFTTLKAELEEMENIVKRLDIELDNPIYNIGRLMTDVKVKLMLEYIRGDKK